MNPPPRFLISVICLNRYAGVKDCLEHVFRHATDFDLILTNQASTDGTRAYFDELAKDSRVTVFHETENIGFIPPGDRAFRIAIERRIPYVLLLNDDTQPPPDFLEHLVRPLEAMPMAALSGPEGGCCELLPDFHGCPGSRVEYIEGSCLMIHVERVRRVVGDKLFDPNLRFIYGDDSNLSLRMREAGYTIHRVPFRMPHITNATTRSPAVRVKCAEAQKANHAYNAKRFGHYMKVRRFDHWIILKRKFAIGDSLLTTPVIRALRKQRPLSPIHVVTDSPDLFKRNSDVSGISREMPEIGDSLVIDLDMAYENRPGVPIIEAYADVAGVKVNDRRLRFDISMGAWMATMEWLKENGIVSHTVALHMDDGSWPGKNWEAAKWKELIAALIARRLSVLVVGQGQGIIDHAAPPVWDLRRRHDFDGLAALLRNCSLFIGVDSFPMHLAMSQGVPTIGLFGSSSPDIIFSDSEAPAIGVQGDPALTPCIGERHRTVGQTFVSCDGACMRSISVDMVLQAVNQILGEP